MSRNYTVTPERLEADKKKRTATWERNEQIYKDWLNRGDTSILDLEIKYRLSRQRISQIIRQYRLYEVMPNMEGEIVT